MKNHTIYNVVLCLTYVFISLVCAKISEAAEEARWEFNVLNSQTFYDQTANNHDLTSGSSTASDIYDPSYSTNTPHGGGSNYSVNFDGSNDYGWTSSPTALEFNGSFTLSTWVKLNSLDLGDSSSTSAKDVIISNFGATVLEGGYQLYFEDGTDPHLKFKFHNSSEYNTVSYDISNMNWQAGTWYHVALEYIETAGYSAYSLYVDGEYKRAGGSNQQVRYGDNPYFMIGNNYDVNNGLNGSLDDVVLFDERLSGDEVRELAEIDISWADDVSDVFSNKARWDKNKVPSYATNVNLPVYSYVYTVTLDDDYEINSLTIGGYGPKLDIGSHELRVYEGGGIYGSLLLSGGSVLGYGKFSMTGFSSEISGYGYIQQPIYYNLGVIRATGGQQGDEKQLSINLDETFVQGNEGYLVAQDYSTLYIRNENNVTNSSVVSLSGGTLKGHVDKYQLINNDRIQGHGVIDDYYVNNAGGSITVSSTGTLMLNEGFYNNLAEGTITLHGTFEVLQPWTNNADLILDDGSITGSTVTQTSPGSLSVMGVINYIQDMIFNAGTVNEISEDAILNITGTATLVGASITESGLGGTVQVANNALLQGYGSISPDVAVDGELKANSNGNTLTVNGALTVNTAKSAYASDGGTLTVNGDVHNKGAVYANSGSLNIDGVIKASSNNNGEFSVTSGQMNVNGSLESNLYNTFVAHTGGTITFANNISTGDFNQTESLKPQGGKITVASGKTFTVAKYKNLRGYGTLSDSTRNMTISGAIIADGGDLALNGNITCSGSLMSEGTTNSLEVNNSVTVQLNGIIRSINRSTITLNNCVNNARIQVENGHGTASVVFNGDASGDGMYKLDNGKMIFNNNLLMNADTVIDDDDTYGSSITVHDNLTKQQGALNDFNADQLSVKVYNKIGDTGGHDILWGAQDMGADVSGLTDNLALFHITFGDNEGTAASDDFEFDSTSIMYCYGITILKDASLDLGGGTIYYLKTGDTINGIYGTGFHNEGSYFNGQIIEISTPFLPPTIFISKIYLNEEGLPTLLITSEEEIEYVEIFTLNDLNGLMEWTYIGELDDLSPYEYINNYYIYEFIDEDFIDNDGQQFYSLGDIR